MKQLLLLRHGKSDWNTHCSDFERPLKKRGKRNAKEMGLWFRRGFRRGFRGGLKEGDREQRLFPDILICSPAKRALNTAEEFSKAIDYPTELIRTDDRIYDAEVMDLLQVISEVGGAHSCILLVGHNPGLDELLEFFVPDIKIPDDGKLLPTATMACIQLSQSWQTLKHDHKVLNYFIQRPKDLP